MSVRRLLAAVPLPDLSRLCKGHSLVVVVTRAFGHRCRDEAHLTSRLHASDSPGASGRHETEADHELACEA